MGYTGYDCAWLQRIYAPSKVNVTLQNVFQRLTIYNVSDDNH